ncbi:MAG: GreA/GreB family elongation factor [Hyphomicrobiales bacterium]
MAQEPETASRPLTLGEAMAEYLQSVKPELRRNYASFIRKFVDYSGDDTLLSSLSGSRVELYAENNIKASDPAAPDRVAALKAFFQYLKKKDYTPQNYGVHIRVRRVAGRSQGTTVRVERAPIEMTAEGIDSLKRQLEELTGKRGELIRAVEVARSDGDLRENAPYHAAREALAFHEQKIKEIEATLARAVIVESSDERSTVGSTVKVTNLDNESVYEYMLVSAREANAAQSRISVESPVGRELLGRRAGEEIRVSTPRGETRFRVEAVNQG